MQQPFEPTIYGRYILMNRIAVGGMAEVFRAKAFGAEGFEKLIAIKRLYPHLSEDESFVRMFINEAKLAANLNHVNTTPIYDFGRRDGLYFIGMEYVRGCDLADLIEKCRERKKQVPLGLAVWLLIEICNGLEYAHRKHDDLGNFLNLIHRDITPQNILLSYEGEVKITDFGIAKAQTAGREETTGGILKGKFSYMSPEQVRGERIDHRSDIFSLGIVAWELLTCQKMFDGPNDYHILEKVREALFIPPRQINPNLPPTLERIVMRALTRLPQDRYPNVGELRLELLRFLSGSQLFPSRAHLSAFIRKLFQERLERDTQRIFEETHKSRKLFETYKSTLVFDHSNSLLPSPRNLETAKESPVQLPISVGPKAQKPFVEVLAGKPFQPAQKAYSDPFEHDATAHDGMSRHPTDGTYSPPKPQPLPFQDETTSQEQTTPPQPSPLSLAPNFDDSLPTSAVPAASARAAALSAGQTLPQTEAVSADDLPIPTPFLTPPSEAIDAALFDFSTTNDPQEDEPTIIPQRDDAPIPSPIPHVFQSAKPTRIPSLLDLSENNEDRTMPGLNEEKTMPGISEQASSLYHQGPDPILPPPLIPQKPAPSMAVIESALLQNEDPTLPSSVSSAVNQVDLSAFEDEEPVYSVAIPMKRHVPYLVGAGTFVLGILIVILISWIISRGVSSHSEGPVLTSNQNRTTPQTSPNAFTDQTPARLQIQASPWAYVYVNGRFLSNTPVDQQLSPGRYNIAVRFASKLSHPKRIQRFQLTLKPGSTTTRKIQLASP